MVAIACDHGGFELKKELIKHLEKQGIDIRDFGCDSADSCDYPDYAHLVTDAIKSGEADKGILLCGTGIGLSLIHI